ncbi:MAG: hydroxymethylbilane synthase [Bacteroidota bacterium]
MSVRAGTRTSRLARWQTAHVLARLEAVGAGPSEVVPFTTKGDRIIDKPLPAIGGKGLFTAELEAALHERRIDLAVHSLKDLPTASVPGLTIGAVFGRSDVRDVIVGEAGVTLEALPEGAIVGTSSHRRAAQVLHHRPDVVIASIRGNVPTRVEKVRTGQYTVAIMAAAGLARLGMHDAIASYLTTEAMIPAPGQGALAVQCRADDEAVLALLAQIDDPQDRAATTAERTFLASLEAGCSTPLAAYASVQPDGTLHMHALVASVDGRQRVEVEGAGGDPVELGEALAEEARQGGALEVLAHG